MIRLDVPILRACVVVTIALTVAGCVSRPGRDYGHLMFRADRYFQVQLVDSGLMNDEKIYVTTLLLLPPVGAMPEVMSEPFALTLWQELQQTLPGRVINLRENGRYAAYADSVNLLADSGHVMASEVVRLGKLADVTHVLLPRIVDYSPYHPQRMIMEWRLFDVHRERTVLIVVGGLDASEQRVMSRADSYLRDRKAKSYNAANLDMLLRSPREFNGFAIAEASEVLEERIIPASKPPFKVNGNMDDIVSELMELK